MSNQTQAGTAGSILHVTLAHILSDEVVLAIHLPLGFVALLASDRQHLQMSAAQFFAPSEMATLMPSVLSHPDYCSTDHLHLSAWFSPVSSYSTLQAGRDAATVIAPPLPHCLMRLTVPSKRVETLQPKLHQSQNNHQEPFILNCVP